VTGDSSVAVVLVVDDDITISSLLAVALTDDGYDVIIASNGLEGIRRLDETCPDLVISDYLMPVLNGVGLLKALRAHPNCHSVPFILMSALPPPKISKLVTDYSAIVNKPFRLDEVVKLVSKILRAA
jgi:DNA-binding response OmpR family regulator